ncbi:Uncharacterised protein [Rikenella microfusus]|uniref:Uncharacterized protein n=1 Tax=Rikenella microfusus TaxID=28139 RepID=A0A379MPA3_9BACT|nr:Uncharacterised protein [Rikenella microfusus]
MLSPGASEGKTAGCSPSPGVAPGCPLRGRFNRTINRIDRSRYVLLTVLRRGAIPVSSRRLGHTGPFDGARLLRRFGLPATLIRSSLIRRLRPEAKRRMMRPFP